MPRKKKKQKKSDKKIAALYCRVSRFDKYADEFSSVEVQEKKMRGYCDLEEWEIFDVYIDENISGATLDRPEFKRMMRDAKAGKFNVVFGYRIDRISRSNKDWHDLLDELDDMDIDIRTVDPAMNTTDATGRLIRDILISFAEFELNIGKERTFDKMYEMANRGIFTGGTAPIGYDLVDKKLVVNKNEETLIKDIINKCLAKSMPAQIAKALNKKGHTTPLKKFNTGNTYGGKPFNANIISKILKNPAYAGYTTWDEELFKGKHKAIIKKKDWDNVQSMMKPKTSAPRTGTGTKLLLTGLLKCGYCDSFMTSQPTSKKMKDGTKKKYWYYRCVNAAKHGADSCKNRQISGPTLDDFILAFASKLASNDKFVDSVFKDVSQKNKQKIKITKTDIKRIDGQISAINKKIANITNAISQYKKGNLSPLMDEMEKLTKQKEEFEENKAKHKLFLNGLQSSTVDIDLIREQFGNLPDLLDKADNDDKSNIISTLISQIILKIPKGSKKGEIITKVRNQPAQTFVYQNGRVCVLHSLAPEEGLEPPTK
ncbi:MAG: recombinase family protein [Candidatus Marinimicrobia bacterium]|nr:recombinase family protein [Candidatus Neomarinimicrobiota bacterium]